MVPQDLRCFLWIFQRVIIYPVVTVRQKLSVKCRLAASWCTNENNHVFLIWTSKVLVFLHLTRRRSFLQVTSIATFRIFLIQNSLAWNGCEIQLCTLKQHLRRVKSQLQIDAEKVVVTRKIVEWLLLSSCCISAIEAAL